MSDHRFLRALRRQSVDCTPVWLMRQAGRYLPEYRALRAKAGDFLTACKTPELACEVTLQPLRRFALDAAIIFSDILTIPDAMGLGLSFAPDHGPRFAHPLRTAADIARLPIPDPENSLAYVMQAIRLVKHELAGKLPLIGFAGSPWTLAAYMITGSSSKDFLPARQLLYQQPELAHTLLKKLTQATIVYLIAQIKAGADAVMIFDTWGGLLTQLTYQAFSLTYMQQIIAGVKAVYPTTPIILFTKNAGQWLEIIAESNCDAVGIDWMTDLKQARHRIGNKVALQGNLDPFLLYADATTIRREVKRVLTDFGHHPGHIFNLGHGIPKDIPFENVAVLVEAVHEFSQL